MIELKIDGEVYTKKEFQRDIVRMFDSLRTRDYEGESRCCCIFVKCKTCPLYDICAQREGFKYFSFETIEKVYRWSKDHPPVTNRDKMIETFGGDYFNLIINYISDGSLEDYDIWLNEEYKKPGKDKQNG